MLTGPGKAGGLFLIAPQRGQFMSPLNLKIPLPPLWQRATEGDFTAKLDNQRDIDYVDSLYQHSRISVLQENTVVKTKP